MSFHASWLSGALTKNAGDDAGVVSTATDSDGNNTVELSGGALKDMQLTLTAAPS